MDSRFQVMDTGIFVRGTWILDSNRLLDPYFLSCFPDSKLRIPVPTRKKFPDSTSKNFPESGFAYMDKFRVFCLRGNNPKAWVNKHLPLAQYFLTKFWSPRYLRPQTDPASSVSV